MAVKMAITAKTANIIAIMIHNGTNSTNSTRMLHSTVYLFIQVQEILKRCRTSNSPIKDFSLLCKVQVLYYRYDWKIKPQ